MAHDVATGIIEFIMDHFTEENEGTYTCQITDGGGKAQSSLVLIGNGKRGQGLLLSYDQPFKCGSNPTKPAVSDYIQQKKNNTLWTVFFFLSECVQKELITTSYFSAY